MAKESGTIYFIAGLLMGGLVGAGIGMLVTPENGSKTREELKKMSGKFIDDASKAFSNFEKTQIRPTVAKVTEQVKSKVDEVKKDGFEKTIEKVKSKISPTTSIEVEEE